MELELMKERFPCCEAAEPLVQNVELSAETIVPDYCPDIERIVESDGSLLLRSWETEEGGRLRVSGTVRMSVLYLAQGERRLRALGVVLPLEAVFDARVPDGCAAVCVEGRLQPGEVRALNPRKIFTAVALTLTARPYLKGEVVACGAVENAEEHGVQTLVRAQEASILCAAREKEFPFTDEFSLPSVREGVRELLQSSVTVRLTESRCVAGKVMLRGLVCAEILYVAANDAVEGFSAELPFSQVIDGAENALDAAVTLRVAEAQLRVAGGDEEGRTLSLTAVLGAFAVLRCTQTLRCIVDLYSTSEELEVQNRVLALSSAPEPLLRQIPVRERIETGGEVRSVLRASVRFAPVSALREEGQLALRTAAEITLLYLDDAGEVSSARRRVELGSRVEAGEDCAVELCACCGDEVACLSAVGGVEVRFPAEIRGELRRTQQLPCLHSLRAQPRAAEEDPVPSLLLRERGGQSLWQLAKTCRTTVEEILRANELASEEEAPAHELLLIPRKRA